MKRLKKHLLYPILLIAFGAILSACAPSTLTVNSDNDIDDGNCDAAHCSLREAINKANTLAGTITIKFNIGGGGVQTIRPASALPVIAVPVLIDGSTQPGFTSVPLIELDGTLAGGGAVDGLVLGGGDSTVKYLVINRYGGNGIRIGAPEGNRIERNYIGTDIDGKVAMGNLGNGILVAGNANTIGGNAGTAGNVISANLGDGVVINGVMNGVQGNLIGLDAIGTAPLGNHGSGVTVNGQLNLIGGTTADARNVISDNGGNGVRIMTGDAEVRGNYIGTDITGSAGLGNHENGVFAFGAGSILIGGSDPGSRNVISANGLVGVFIEDGTNGVEVYGNYIGTDAAGISALKNIKAGIRVGGANHRIGSSIEGTRNLISGNGGPGVAVISTATGIKIQNNFIGTDLAGKGALGNRNGIEIGLGAGLTDVLIGGQPNGEGNVISGNVEQGVLLNFGAKVQGNKIGTDDTGLGPLGNGANGILAKGSRNQIGGMGFHNTIAFNGKHGVAVISESGVATGNTISWNSIHDNGMLGIAIDEDSVIPNDPTDPDPGDNNRQNFPVILSAISDPVAIETTFTAKLDSTPNTAFTIEFSTNAACDPSGYGEGHRSVKSMTVTTDAGGHADIVALFPMTMFDTANFVTATATDPRGNTSGFSNCIQVTEAVDPTLPVTPTHTPNAMTFTPFVDPSAIFYGPRCTPNEVQIAVEIGNPPEEISYVLLFVRLMDPKAGAKTPWSEGLSMLASVKNKYFYNLPAYDVPEYDKFEAAVLQYQFVVYNKGQAKIGYSEVFGDIAFSRCSPNKVVNTPTPRAGVK